jgi:uncharacterized protein
MSTTGVSAEVLEVIAENRDDLQKSFTSHAARNPRLFGSVARGDATPAGVIDIIVELLPGGANPLMRLAGLSEESRLILDLDVDVVAVAQMALDHAVAI